MRWNVLRSDDTNPDKFFIRLASLSQGLFIKVRKVFTVVKPSSPAERGAQMAALHLFGETWEWALFGVSKQNTGIHWWCMTAKFSFVAGIWVVWGVSLYLTAHLSVLKARCRLHPFTVDTHTLHLSSQVETSLCPWRALPARHTHTVW